MAEVDNTSTPEPTLYDEFREFQRRWGISKAQEQTIIAKYQRAQESAPDKGRDYGRS